MATRGLNLVSMFRLPITRSVSNQKRLWKLKDGMMDACFAEIISSDQSGPVLTAFTEGNPEDGRSREVKLEKTKFLISLANHESR